VSVWSDGVDAVGFFPRFSAYGIRPSRICGKSCNTAIVGLCAPATSPLFTWCCVMGDPLPYLIDAPIRTRIELVSQF
jgi:hypothetical protein